MEGCEQNSQLQCFLRCVRHVVSLYVENGHNTQRNVRALNRIISRARKLELATSIGKELLVLLNDVDNVLSTVGSDDGFMQERIEKIERVLQRIEGSSTFYTDNTEREEDESYVNRSITVIIVKALSHHVKIGKLHRKQILKSKKEQAPKQT